MENFDDSLKEINDVKGIVLGFENTEWPYIPIKYIKELILTDLEYSKLGYNHAKIFKLVIDKNARHGVKYDDHPSHYNDILERIEKYRNIVDLYLVCDEYERWDKNGLSKYDDSQILLNWYDSEPYDYDNYSEKVSYTEDGDLVLTVTKQADNLALLDI